MLPDGLSEAQLTERERFWLGHIRHFKEVGGQLTVYATQNGFTPRVYYYWRSKLSRMGFVEFTANNSKLDFQKLEVVASLPEETASGDEDKSEDGTMCISCHAVNLQQPKPGFCRTSPVIGGRQGGNGSLADRRPSHYRCSLATVCVRLPNGVSVEVSGNLQGLGFGEVLRHAATVL